MTVPSLFQLIYISTQQIKQQANKTTVKLDVGGTVFRASKEILLPSIYLVNLVNGDWINNQEETIFIDRIVFISLRTGKLDLEDRHHLFG